MYLKLYLAGIFLGAYVSTSQNLRNSTRFNKDDKYDKFDDIVKIPKLSSSSSTTYQLLSMTDFWSNLPKLLELKLLMLGVEQDMLEILSTYTENIKDYGCWCRPFFNATLKGTPIDEMDKACQRFFKSCQCNDLLDNSCSENNSFDTVEISIGMLDDNLDCLLQDIELGNLKTTKITAIFHTIFSLCIFS